MTHANGNALNGLRILIVEDEAAISLLLASDLEGYIRNSSHC